MTINEAIAAILKAGQTCALNAANRLRDMKGGDFSTHGDIKYDFDGNYYVNISDYDADYVVTFYENDGVVQASVEAK